MHPDHMTGDALVKELTGAKVMAMEEDVPALNNIRPGGRRIYRMTEKYARLEKGEPNPFIDPAGYKALIDSSEQAFNARVQELKSGPAR